MKHETKMALLELRANYGDPGARLALEYGKIAEGSVAICYCDTDEDAVRKAKEWDATQRKGGRCMSACRCQKAGQ